ncbi:BON domain-containing protein [Ciceribacter sp. L1K22]|uniref:BON domain-containing protein n=1 Tax=Ciceribacter sp. L1K22 TaxID=2820275 RepID=UPI001ABE446A|nr:BON domain-containing protein [Ciceribacter sp. L1K22]MBO3759221.1 BON domain-containing protein [Ciceribacter sp. L1K22]
MQFKPQTFHGEPPVVEIENPTQELVERRVADLLAVSDGIDASDIEVTETGGDIVLSGSVSREGEIERAVEIVRSIPEVGNIILRLRLRDPLAGAG